MYLASCPCLALNVLLFDYPLISLGREKLDNSRLQIYFVVCEVRLLFACLDCSYSTPTS